MSKTYRILMWLLTLTAFVIAIDSHVKMTHMSESLAAKPDTAVVESIEMPRTITQVVTVTVAAAAVPGVVAQTAASSSSDDALAPLQAELEKTRKALASREAELTRLQGLLTNTNTSRRAFFEARMDARMEQMKTEDPARYAEMQQQRTNFLQNIQAQAASRVDFLSSVDTSTMADEQLANHNQLIQLTQRVQTLIAQMPTMPPDEQLAAREELLQDRPVLNTLYQNERATLLS